MSDWQQGAMVPVPRGQHDGIIQKIVDGSQQVFPSLGSISHTVELLSYGREKKIADMSVLKKKRWLVGESSGTPEDI